MLIMSSPYDLCVHCFIPALYVILCIIGLFRNRTISAFYEHCLTLFPAWISNYTHYDVWDEITYPFLNFNSAPTLYWACDYLSVLGLKLNHVNKRGHGNIFHYTSELLKWVFVRLQFRGRFLRCQRVTIKYVVKNKRRLCIADFT